MPHSTQMPLAVTALPAATMPLVEAPPVVDLTVLQDAQNPVGGMEASWGLGDTADPDLVFQVYGRAAGRFNEEVAFDSWTDCEVLSRVWEDEDSAGCCGLNGACMFRQVMDLKFWDVLQETKVKIVRGLNDRRHDAEQGRPWPGPYVHGFRCKAGRHRSLSCAALVRACCQLHGFVVNIRLLTTAECGCPFNCKKLRHLRLARHEAKAMQMKWFADGEAALVVAQRYWQYAHEFA